MALRINLKQFAALAQRIVPMLIQQGIQKEQIAAWLKKSMEEIKAREASTRRTDIHRSQLGLVDDYSALAGTQAEGDPYSDLSYLRRIKQNVDPSLTGLLAVPETAEADIGGAQKAAREFMAALMQEDPTLGAEQLLPQLEAVIRGYGFPEAEAGVSAFEDKKRRAAERELEAAGVKSRSDTAAASRELSREQLAEKTAERLRLEKKDEAEKEGDTGANRKAKIDMAVSVLQQAYPDEDEATLRKWATEAYEKELKRKK